MPSSGAARALQPSRWAQLWWLPGALLIAALVLTSLGLAGVICVGVVTAFAIQQPKSQRPVGEYLAAHRASHEPVVFLDDYFFESPSMRAWIVPP